MDEAVLEGVGRALKKLYVCDAAEQLPPRWLELLSRLDERSEARASVEDAPATS